MKSFIIFLMSLFFSVGLRAQFCSPATVTLPITPTTAVQYTPSYSTGIISFPFTATAGCSYTFSTCGLSSNDTYLRLYNSSFVQLGAWDDQCGLQSTFTWTCPGTGQYYVHLSRFVCAFLNSPTSMSYTVSCPTPPCVNPIVNAGQDVVICSGQSTNLNGTVTAGAGSTGGSSGTLTVTISSPIQPAFLDETSWILTNAAGTIIGSGGPYVLASTNTVAINNPGSGPYTFFIETQGAFNDNNATFSILCGGNVVNTGSITGGQTTSTIIAGCNGSGGGSTPVTYVWSPGATLSSNNILTPTATPTTTTTYTLTATSNGCTANDQVVVTVNPTPVVSVNNVVVCSGQTATLTATPSIAGGTYLWSPGNETTSSISVTPNATTNYSVSYTLNGCNSAISSGTVTVSNVIDWANIQSPGVSTICEGQPTSIFGQVFEPGVTNFAGQGPGITVEFAYNTVDTDPSTWPSASWTTANYNPSGISLNNDEYSGVIPALTPGTYYYAFRYTMNGCTSYGAYNATGGGFWDGTNNVNGTLIINPNITPTFNPIAAECAGTILSPIPSTSLNGFTGTWTPALNNQQTTTYTFTPSAGICATIASLNIEINPLPVAAITPPATNILTCSTANITLDATGGGTYSWSDGSTILGTSSALNVTSLGTYTVTVTGANGCSATATQIITQNITPPMVSITPLASNILTCSTTSISLTANGTGDFAWTNPTLISTNPLLTVSTPGNYTVTLTAANGCTGTATQSITQNITPPAATIIAPSTTVITCTTTSISLTATGGGTYSWSDGMGIVGTSATIVVTSPGTYTVTVTGTNGCTATAATTITQNTSSPTAGINVPNTTILTCATTNIPLTATGGGSYSWYSGTANVGNTSSLSVTNPGFYTVVVTAPNGCTSLTNIVITQDIVAPIASIANNTNSTILDCNTTQISLTGGGGISASWSNGTTNVSSTAALTVTTAGTYTYTVTNANGCIDSESITITFTPNTIPTFNQIGAICENGAFTLPSTSTNNVQGTWSPAPNYSATTTYTFQPNSGLCANSTNMTVTVHPYPVISILNDTICNGQSTTINSTVNLPGGTYIWTPTNGVTANILVSPTSTTTYQVIYSLFGCTDTSTSEIFVKPVSIPQAINQTICSGQTAQLVCTTPLTGGVFVWSNGITNDTIVVSPPSTTNYFVVYNLNGCLSSPVGVVISVNPIPALGINNSTICAGSNALITAISNLPGGTYSWGTPGIVGAASQVFSPMNDTTITVSYTLNGCTSPIAVSSITVNPLPIATFSANVTQGCNPLSVTFSADDNTNSSYTWTTSNGLNATGSQADILFQMNGTFDVSLTANLNGCSVTETIANYIQVDNYPIALFEPSSEVFTEPNQTMYFMNNSLGAATYLWDFGDGGISTEEGPAHLFENNEDGFDVVLTAVSTLGCSDTANYFIGFDPGLVYYIPNSFTPDGDMFNQTFNPVFTSGIDSYNYNLYVYNRWGELIFESSDPVIGWDGSIGEEGKDCQAGVYTYQIFIKIPNFDERKMILGQVNLIR
ncbi:MAG: gliding motility-associated C-terminal domain-containing protein [Crocinitomicaceae bacterium]|jgi:gliding motility-associated-like protein|nr:gliding motility-associated C-terminal domain-containing protein [Crocinitomicaceae bacterium]